MKKIFAIAFSLISTMALANGYTEQQRAVIDTLATARVVASICPGNYLVAEHAALIELFSVGITEMNEIDQALTGDDFKHAQAKAINAFTADKSAMCAVAIERMGPDSKYPILRRKN